MMGRGSDRGCGLHESACRPNSRFLPFSEDAVEDFTSQSDYEYSHVDFFNQARKILAERSPFDIPEDSSAPSGSSGLISSSNALPFGLTNLLKNSGSRKKYKKSQSGGEKSSVRVSERSKSQSVWADTDDYFRELALNDVDTLHEVSSMPKWSEWKKNFFIPCSGFEKKDMDIILRQAEEYFEEVNNATEVDIDLKEKGLKGRAEKKISGGSCSGNDIAWLVGCSRRKMHKENKSSIIEANFETIFTVTRSEENCLCDFCCQGDLNWVFDKLITCQFCKMSVHRRCYGVCDTIDASDWICSACKQASDVSSNEKSCVLCTKKGGALKPFAMDNKTSLSFAHMFCFIWIPELFIDDTENMSPIKYLDGVQEAKKMSLCCVCKSKCGTCIQCSSIACKTTFHPTCGRESGYTMEVWGNPDRTNALLRAFCSKHSSIAAEVDADKSDQYEDSFFASSQCKDTSGSEESKRDDRKKQNLNITLILKKLIDRGKVNVEDLAFEIDVSPSLLSTFLKDNCVPKELECKICLWLGRNAYLVPSRRMARSNLCISENGIKIDYDLSKSCKDEIIPIVAENVSRSSCNETHAVGEDYQLTASNRDKISPREGNLNYFIHPSLTQKLKQVKRTLHLESEGALSESEGDRSCLEASNGVSLPINHGHEACRSVENSNRNEESNEEKPSCDSKLLQIPPEDDVEGELIYYQHKLLERITSRKRLTDNLICKVAKNLPVDIEEARTRKWDLVLVNQYLANVREVKKQFRKERKHNEAQAVLAAATAAAAASVRNSSLRKDALDDPEKHNMNSRSGNSSHVKSRAKDSVASRSSIEKHSDAPKDSSLSCDVCGRSESLLNPIFVCSSCKVAVHVDCYRSINGATGPWHCEPCEELMTVKSRQSASFVMLEKQQLIAQCAICGGTSGAIRKTSEKQWVHAFCAEWVLESTFRRGQANPIEGVGALSREEHVCCVCQSNFGVCLKCGFGHCQITFHPSCARSAGFFMNTKNVCGKYQHKAYCERHGSDQRLKAESHKHGSEDLKNLKQIRVELEKLRLLCERIVKREKIKRELVTCSHALLACKRDHVARSLRRRVPYPQEVSSESATTSLKGHVDGFRSFSDAVQRSDDVTVDSSVSVKQRVRSTLSNEDSSASQNPNERMPFGGKKIPRRFSPVPHSFDDGEWSSGARRVFEKEVLLTSDQAFVKNRQLPKGYVYVPVNGREKRTRSDRSSSEESDHNA